IAGTGKVDFSKLELEEQVVSDVAASFEQAVVDCLVAKAVLACQRHQMQVLCVGGGVAANRRLRAQLQEACEANDIELHIAPFELCTDNAVMGAIAFEKIKANQFAELDVDSAPGLVRQP
ncbi:MAG TPA: tRNA (adenosine(37)-N6)-threonylcarbamoyltransferase complex transferase subunit TsaD, partial [Planctomycetaceae bacterium]|nr:tRNA (adenosine(37)-N6)-threonylcarbamoyltransferase complex transferase subunit TsaD [Planctomycetaceae bacterium]